MDYKKIKQIINLQTDKLVCLRDKQRKLIAQLYGVSDKTKIIQAKKKIFN